MRPIAELALTEQGVKDYLQSVGTTKEGSIETYCVHLGVSIKRARELGLPPILKMTKRDVGSLTGALKALGSYSTYVRKLKAFWTFHERADLVKALPKVKDGKTKVGPNDILSMEEINRLLGATVSKRDRALVVALFETGGRITEVLSVNVENVSRVQNGDGKAYFEFWFGAVKVEGEEHWGYLRESASVQIMDEWLRSYPREVVQRPRPLFPSFMVSRSEPGRLTPDGANKILKDASKRAAIGKNMHAHIFRHSRATDLLRRGVQETIIKRMLGWTANSRMLSRYTHLSNADVKAALGLSDNEAKPADLLVPSGEVPNMPDLPQGGLLAMNKAAIRLAQLERQMAELREAKPEVRTMADLRERSDLATKIAVAEWDAKTDEGRELAALKQERAETAERMARMEAALAALLQKEAAQ